MNSRPALNGQTILERGSFYEDEIRGCGDRTILFEFFVY
jgi:hypothetical protein